MQQLSSIVCDETLKAVWNPLCDPSGNEKIDEKAQVVQLFSLPDKIAKIALAINDLRKSQEANVQPEACAKLLSEIGSHLEKNGASCGLDPARQAEFIALCSGTPVSYSDRYSKFMADKNWRLADFGNLITSLSANDFAQSRKLQHDISDLSKADPEWKTKNLPKLFLETPDCPAREKGHLPWNAAYDENRIGANEQVEGKIVTLNWSDMRMPFQRYFVGGCPFTFEGVAVLFNHLIAEKCPFIASVHQAGQETSDRIQEFWKPESLQKVQLKDGWSWSLSECTSEVLQDVYAHREGSSSEAQPLPLADQQQTLSHAPQIVKSLIVIRRGEERREIVHFHYIGWDDFKSYPSLAHLLLFATCLIRIKTLPGIPRVFNCRGGVGRSGIVAGLDVFLLETIDQLKNGVDLEEIRLPVAERFCQFRKQRRIFLDGHEKVVDVLRPLFEVYKIIKIVGVERFLNELDLRLSC
jgi:protein tyrosine phosphatase